MVHPRPVRHQRQRFERRIGLARLDMADVHGSAVTDPGHVRLPQSGS